MYERFTDRARKVMQLASQEALRFNHEYIGTEHILLGLVKEGSGVAANVLKNLDIDLRKIRLEVEKMVQSGPDMVTIGGKLPQTPKAKKVIEHAIEEARNLKHNYVGTEHLLLGLLCEEEGVGAQVLMNLGLKLEDVRVEVLKLLGQPVERENPAASSKEVQGFLMEPCPECGGPMKLRQGPRGLFLGCAAYPRCKGVRPSGQVPLDDQQERIRALERQLGTVRFLFGAFLGTAAGALAGSGLGSVVGFLVGCAVALWGRLVPALLAGALGGALAGWARMGNDAGAVVGAVGGALLAGCVAELGQPPARSRSRPTPRPRRQPPSNA